MTSNGVHFRVWAPKRNRVEVVVESGAAVGEHLLRSEEDRYFTGVVARAAAGDLYRYRLDGDGPFPDPVSRFQPDGPFGPSQVVNPAAFAWTDDAWKGRSLAGQVIYELHVGTFTRAGTWAAASEQLPHLAELGVTVLEVMPVGDFPGRFGWGYDGVNLYAPTRLYGTPDDFRGFVDAAHRHRLAVILDVVYNHLGPDGCYLAEFGPYFSDTHVSDWGNGLNFDGLDCERVREFVAANAGYWVDEFHLDGLRIDASQSIHDDSPRHILADIAARVRLAARGRATIVVNENEPQDVKLVRPAEQGGYGLDGLWNEDFHHTGMVALTGRAEAYYSDHAGGPQELVSAAKYGFLFQGQRYAWQEARRGTPTFDVAPWRVVNYLQNHDQVANSGHGHRAHRQTSPGRLRAATACLLLFPGTPMLFMGQEFAASAPFYYFADAKPELAPKIRAGRVQFMSQFRSMDRPDLTGWLPDPDSPETVKRCRLDHTERETNADVYRLHKDLLTLRRTDAAFGPSDVRKVDGAVLGPRAFVVRYFAAAGDRLLLVNFGTDQFLDRAPEPLLAPPVGHSWRVVWSSDDPAYGGTGTAHPEVRDGWRLPGEAALVMAPDPLPPADLKAVRKYAERLAKERREHERTRFWQ
ncbi:Malto-oligosyltrehalose trehalohydrolase [Urbifossiella limnaea]|uniref:Malto-oligosyltrehalose trehalohydrolase n=1 Tax=Urbifossiella limnaea TaxID=2528023 RepID=A0A517XSM9_9BACT|nr:Malto-oligosyltrehalose trehalohydrolase [Urbifossiella limnaea]